MKSARRRSREFALQALYQWQLAQHSAAELETQYILADGFNRADAALFKKLVQYAVTHAEALQTRLMPHLDRQWNEVSPVEKGILLIGATELVEMVETPYRVIINEAIELAKSFGGTDGHKYINGVLDKLAAAVRADEVDAAAQAKRPRAQSS